MQFILENSALINTIVGFVAAGIAVAGGLIATGMWIQRTNTATRRSGIFIDKYEPHPEKAYYTGDVTERASAIRLSKKGKRIFNDIGGEAMVEKYFPKVKIPRDADKYAIQQICQHYANGDLANHLSAEDRQKVRDYAYENGYFVETVLASLGVPLRDKALENMKNR